MQYRIIRSLAVALVLVMAAASGTAANGIKDGMAAADAGDYVRAFEQWSAAAAQGSAAAQNNLGILYANGQGVPRDLMLAADWFRKAAEQGDAAAQGNLGMLYAKGEGVLRDDKQAVKWLTMAARQGHTPAQFNLGVMYDVGRGVTANPVVACAWYLMAADGGVEAAREFAGELLAALNPDEVAMARQIAEQARQEIGR